MSGIRKLILIVILILFQTSVLTIGGMTGKALLNGTGTNRLDVKLESNTNGTNAEYSGIIYKDASPQQSGNNTANESQQDKSTIEIEAVVKEDLVEVHKVIKKDEAKSESSTTSIIPIPEEQSQIRAGAK